ncbi:PREDICTED: uncharacterized protein LOC104600558 [Nelumbo nucifera]|uniref:Uncharacterized protein LOC104600558 n=1 Tax=Nelumbo nucifera TaxID=4432 RepID=A0A1U8AHF0_NELNU|nr:PREDICTED: uncharacterized protein LOC104600558 [Nelumbo nucifera]
MMSIALDRSSNRIEGSGFIRGMSCMPIFDSSESGRTMPGVLEGDRRFPGGNMASSADKVDETGQDFDSCSSSIGRNSDSGRSSAGSDGEDSGETEVQSSYKGPLDTMNALEDVLPTRRSISKFYCGKSKSFTSLADAASSTSIKDIVKPENAYTRKRKNLLACSNLWDKNRSFPLRSNGGGISKRPTNSSRSTLSLAVAMSSSSESNNTSEGSSSNASPPRLLPPLHPQAKPSLNSSSSSQRTFSSWRSFSLTDLQGVAAATTSTSNRDKHKRLH